MFPSIASVGEKGEGFAATISQGVDALILDVLAGKVKDTLRFVDAPAHPHLSQHVLHLADSLEVGSRNPQQSGDILFGDQIVSPTSACPLRIVTPVNSLDLLESLVFQVVEVQGLGEVGVL